MSKIPRRRRRRSADTPRRTRQIDRPARPQSLALRDARDGRGLVERILDTPHAARVVRQLQPEVLHRVIQTVGLEDCGDLVAFATPAQLQRVFDLDLWRPPRAGMDEQLDPDRFGVWLEVLMESGTSVAAQKLVVMDAGVVIAALAQHLHVFDHAAAPSSITDGVENGPERAPAAPLVWEVGGYTLAAKRTDTWDTIIALLLFLDAEHPDYFHRVMRGCRRLSNSMPEIDGLHELLTDREQNMFDLAVDRERRREEQGYVAPAEARAFLQSARQLQLGEGAAPPRSQGAGVNIQPLEPAAHAGAGAKSGFEPASGAATLSEDPAAAIAPVLDALVDAGVLPRQPRGLLEAPADDPRRPARLLALMESARDIDAAACSTRTGELARLANTVLAGCSIQTRPFTAREAWDAAAAACNLGLENWPARWLGKDGSRESPGSNAAVPGERFLVDHDLITVFQVGWTVLHEDVCMYVAGELIRVLSGLQTDDGEIQAGLDRLRVEMTRELRAGVPWRARAALDVIMILDKPAWAALVGLIDECPVTHAAVAASRSKVHTVSASAFEFISDNTQVASIREFMRSLPGTLAG